MVCGACQITVGPMLLSKWHPNLVFSQAYGSYLGEEKDIRGEQYEDIRQTAQRR